MTKAPDIKHHLSDDLLMAYSSGDLPEAFSLVVATHISLCDTCRAALAEFDALGGALLGLAPEEPVAMDDEALAATLAMIDNAPEEPEPPHRLRSDVSVFPEPLREYVAGDIDSVRWRKIGGGVSQMVLQTSDTASVRLLKIPGGAAMPDHGHNGTELTLVLKGAFADEEDRFGRGDVEVANEEVNHHPVAEAGEDCICLAATDAPLKFEGIIPRIAQKFARI